MPKAHSRNRLERSAGPAGSEGKRARAARVLRRGSDRQILKSLILPLDFFTQICQLGVLLVDLHSSPTPQAQLSRLHERERQGNSERRYARAARVLRRGSDLQLSRFQRGDLPSSPTPPMAQQSRRHEPARPAQSSHVHMHADAAVRRGRALRATGRAACCMRDAGVLRRRPPVLRTAGASHRHRGRTWGSVSASGSVEVSYGRLKTGTSLLSALRSLSNLSASACAAEHAESAQPQRTRAVGRPGGSEG